MNNGMTNRVTSLSFSQYDPKDYILDHESGMKLSSINKILLNLFNNDLYAYTILVGKMKGLWWKYWFADATRPGYVTGDMVYVNGVQEMQFLRKYWKGVQQIANYNVISNKLPDFRSNDDDIVTKYMNALTDYFHLGNRGLAGQIYISLKDNNKDPVPVTTSWQPYLVTDEELQRREYQLSDLLEDAVRNHNSIYHVGLDKLDLEDSEYETDITGVQRSIYNHVLGTYLPKVRIVHEEHQSWVDFVASSSSSSNGLLGFGTEAFDFLHIFKPLGTEAHSLETWVRTDGHVLVKGYIPVAMLTEVVPDAGTIEYNKWKMGGLRRYGMRLDYLINDEVSKLFFKSKDEPEGDSVQAAPAPRTAKIQYKRDASKDAEYADDFSQIETQISELTDSLGGLQSQMEDSMSKGQNEPKFPSPNDYWSRDAEMIYPAGGYSMSLIESKYTLSKEDPFAFNPKKIASDTTDTPQWMIDPKYKKNDSVVGLVHPSKLLNDTAAKTNPGWAHWDVNSDTVVKIPKNENQAQDEYVRNVMLSMKDMSTSLLDNLLYYANPQVKAMTTSTGEPDERTLGGFLSKCEDEKFNISRYETVQINGELKNQTFTYIEYARAKKADGTIDKTKPDPIPVPKTVRGTLKFQYNVLSKIEATVKLRQPRPSSETRAEDVVTAANDLATKMIDDLRNEQTSRIYTILSYNPGTNASVLFYPKNCSFPFSDILNHPEVLEQGHDAVFRELFNEDEYSHRSGETDDDALETHVFIKKNKIQRDDGPNVPSPIDTTDEKDPKVVSSDVRMIRNFGITRSPALKSVLFCKVSPDASDLIAPSLVNNPTSYVGKWGWLTGQTLVFDVPNNTHNISFEVEGMMKEDNIDFSVYDIRKNDSNGQEGYNLQWVYDLVMNYEFPKAVIMAAYANGFENEWWLPRMIRNMSGMMSKIEHCVIDYPTFISFMQFRTLDIAPLDGLLGQLRSRVNGYLRDTLGTEEFRKHAKMLEKLYGYIYNYIAERLRFKALHDCYSELMAGAVTTEQSRIVMMHRLQMYLQGNRMRRDGQTPNDWIAEVEDAIKEAENEIVSLVNGGDEATAGEISSAVKRLKALHEAYVAEVELESESPANLPNLDPNSQEYRDELKKYQDKYLDNFKEVDAYLEEVENTLTSARKARDKINDYLQVDWLDETTKIYLNYQLSKLNDSMERYKVSNTRICTGYDKYVRRWMSILGIGGSTALRLGFTVNNLLDGNAPFRSLKTVKSELEAFA